MAADYVIMPSRQEGMPNVVMEGMALGKPVLAANVNGVPELMKHLKTGYIFEPLKVEAIAEAMNYAIDNHATETALSWGALAKRHVAENFTVESMLDKLENYFYKRINASTRK